MNTIISSDPLSAPHLLTDPRLSAFPSGWSLSRTGEALCGHLTDYMTAGEQYLSPTMSSRKRKASEEPENDRMSTSPTNSPSTTARLLPSSSSRTIKRTRTTFLTGRPLPLPRLLQTMSATDMRQLLQTICEQRPEIKQEVLAKSPRPSVEATFEVLSKYERDFREAFPFGNKPTSDYAYNRVKDHFFDLLEALRDFTPQYLPPQETQVATSLKYLDEATNILHRLPDWEDFQHQRHKQDAYDDIARAWLLVLKEAQKSAGIFRLQVGGWDQKLAEHNQKSDGKLNEVVLELRKSLGFMHTDEVNPGLDDRMNIRQQLFSGTYGQDIGVGPGSGHW